MGEDENVVKLVRTAENAGLFQDPAANVNGWRDRLRAIIEQRGGKNAWKRLSKEAGLGETFVRDVLDYDKDPSVANLTKLATQLGVSVSEILEGTPPPYQLQSEREARRSRGSIAERLELIRHLLGKSQKDFATEAGVAESTYSQYKTGTNAPNVEEAHKLCDRWGLTLDWIYRGDTRGLSPDLSAAIEAIRRARTAS